MRQRDPRKARAPKRARLYRAFNNGLGMPWQVQVFRAGRWQHVRWMADEATAVAEAERRNGAGMGCAAVPGASRGTIVANPVYRPMAATRPLEATPERHATR